MSYNTLAHHPCQQESWNPILKKERKQRGETSLLDFVAAQIKELRTSYNSGEGLSQETLAAQLNVAANTISRWETGVYQPGLHDLEKLARFFGVSVVTFLAPEMLEGEDENLAALLRTARQLHPDDLEELMKYAEFRKARSMYQGKGRRKSGRKAVKK
ncbi:MAG TPA: helix-turn-helix transcriptional regulator [Pyrinomonadaceae bacterium]|nr:helix-turn-helix transcriptional regulator [Pyrinomonadaceae bacterium]